MNWLEFEDGGIKVKVKQSQMWKLRDPISPEWLEASQPNSMSSEGQGKVAKRSNIWAISYGGRRRHPTGEVSPSCYIALHGITGDSASWTQHYITGWICFGRGVIRGNQDTSCSAAKIVCRRQLCRAPVTKSRQSRTRGDRAQKNKRKWPRTWARGQELLWLERGWGSWRRGCHCTSWGLGVLYAPQQGFPNVVWGGAPTAWRFSTLSLSWHYNAVQLAHHIFLYCCCIALARTTLEKVVYKKP